MTHQNSISWCYRRIFDRTGRNPLGKEILVKIDLSMVFLLFFIILGKLQFVMNPYRMQKKSIHSNMIGGLHVSMVR